MRPSAIGIPAQSAEQPPTHLGELPASRGAWRERVRGLRANASRRSHAELDAATELDAGDPSEFGQQVPDAAKADATALGIGRLLRHRPSAQPRDLRGLPAGLIDPASIPATRRAGSARAVRRRGSIFIAGHATG